MKLNVKIILFTLRLLLTLNIYAAYLKNIPQQIIQPNGTAINCFASGDEFHNWLHDKKNYTIIQNHETGWYVYAAIDNGKLIPSPFVVGSIEPEQVRLVPGANISVEEWRMKREEFWSGTEDIYRSTTPNTGNVNNLVINIRFNDQEPSTASYYWATQSYNRTDNFSLFGYYQEVSNGQLLMTSRLYPIPPDDTLEAYVDSHDRDYFCPYDAITNPIGYQNYTQRREREWQLLRDAVAGVSSQISPGIDFDANNDGILDAVIFEIQGDSAGGWSSLLWPHFWGFHDVPPNSYPVVNGLNIVNYCFVMGVSSCAAQCHEMFHSIGAPDLYHYPPDDMHPVDRWDLMADSWNPPAHMLTYMKWKYGNWFNNIPVITSSGTYTLSPVSTSPFSCYKIPSPFSTNEYFMVEYRRDEGFFEHILPSSGLIIYRIDTTAGDGNADGPPEEIYVYRPDGTLVNDGDPYHANYSEEEERTSIHRFTNPSPFLQDGSEGGLVLYNIGSAGSTISFTYAQELTIYWEGDVSSDWNNPSNWLYDAVPTVNDNVVITPGAPYSPIISVGSAYCKSLIIQREATLTQTGTDIFPSYLYVSGNLDSDAGTFTQSGNASLYFTGASNNWWDDDNEDDTYSKVLIQKSSSSAMLLLQQNVTVEKFAILEGRLLMNSVWSLSVMSDESSAFQVENGGMLLLQDGTLNVPNGDIVFEDGSQADVTGGLIKCGGDFRVFANTAYDIQFTGGTLEMCGTSTQYYQDLDGNTEVYNFIVNKSSGTCFVHVGDLHVLNDITIISGILNANNNDIYVRGDWTNNAGEAGFVETTGTVIFNGTDFSEITTDETFYNLTENSTSIHSNGLQLNNGLTLTVINDLNINLGKFELDSWSTLIVGNDVYIANGSGLNAYGDFGLEIFVGGDWTNDNTYWNTGQGYSPGTEVITFNGSADQFITTQAPQEDFGYLVINKSGGEFRPNDNIHVMHDLDILAGGWHDNAISLTHYFEGDFYIAAGAVGYWNSTTDNTVVFTGLSDQTVFNTVGVGYFRNIVIDKTEWTGRELIISEGTEYNQLNQLDGFTRDRNMTVTLMSDIDMQMGVGLTVEEGTLDLNGNTLSSMGDVTVLLGGTLVVDEGSTLQISNGNSLYVYNGGTLEVIGSPGNMAHITHRVFGNYGFNIYPGGLIKAQYGLFEYMTANGVYVWNGGIIDETYSFNYCTFQNGFVGLGTLLYINNATDLSITGAYFPDASSSDFNVAKTQNPDWGTITMINATGIFAGEAFDQDAYELINWYDLPAIDDLTIYRDELSNLVVLDWSYPNAMAQFRIYKSTDPYNFPTADYITSYTSGYSEPITNTRYFYKVTAEVLSD